MPDLSAAEFTLLQGAHLFAPEDRASAMFCSRMAKLLPSALTSPAISYRTVR